MDIVLDVADSLFIDSIYKELGISADFGRDSVIRQSFSLWAIALLGVTILYFSLSTLSYELLYDKRLTAHPKFLKNQIQKEIWLSVTSFPITSAVTVPWFLGEVWGYSKLYHSMPASISQFFIEMAGFIFFTDFGVYWIHRLEHHPMLYSWLHKPHHAWKISTPYASFAFHPFDGYFQSIPMHLYVYFFPMNAYAYLAAFIFIQLWTISIHDGVYMVTHPAINSSAHHTIHHLEFNYNYGQYFTLWDRIGGSYKRPEHEFKWNLFWDKIRFHRQVVYEFEDGPAALTGSLNSPIESTDSAVDFDAEIKKRR